MLDGEWRLETDDVMALEPQEVGKPTVITPAHGQVTSAPSPTPCQEHGEDEAVAHGLLSPVADGAAPAGPAAEPNSLSAVATLGDACGAA